MYFGTYSQIVQIVLYARYRPLYNVLVVFGNLAICAPFYLFTKVSATPFYKEWSVRRHHLYRNLLNSGKGVNQQ